VSALFVIGLEVEDGRGSEHEMLGVEQYIEEGLASSVGIRRAVTTRVPVRWPILIRRWPPNAARRRSPTS
jgi:hypothetical protein